MVERMRVGVNEAGCYGCSSSIDDARTRPGERPDFGIRAYGGQALATHCHRLGDRALGYARPHTRVHDHEFGNRGQEGHKQ